MARHNPAKSASRRIFNAMGIFSGVRVGVIACSLVRNKLIAWLIGPAGMGLLMLYNSFVDLISQTARLSIDQSAQRDISGASRADTDASITVLRKWALWLGLAGSAVMCLLSPFLSFISFDSFDRWPTFCLLAIVPICYVRIACYNTENQGLRRFKAVAMANILGAVVGLALTVPLIIWLRIRSIPWIIVTYAITSWLGCRIFRPRIKKIQLSHSEIIRKGRSFVRLGFQITLATAIGQGAAYLFVLFLNTYASTDILGIYQAGYTIMNSYVGIIFSALWVEYFPRMAGLAHSPRRLSIAASHEARLTLTLLTPLLCGLIIFVKPVIRLVYSSDFLAIAPYIVVGCIGIVFRVTSWCLAYVILARGDGRAYLTSEITSVVIGLALNITGYIFGGFFGLGIAYMLWYGAYTVIVATICRRRYGVVYTARTWAYVALSVVVVSCAAVAFLLITG